MSAPSPDAPAVVALASTEANGKQSKASKGAGEGGEGASDGHGNDGGLFRGGKTRARRKSAAEITLGGKFGGAVTRQDASTGRMFGAGVGGWNDDSGEEAVTEFVVWEWEEHGQWHPYDAFSMLLILYGMDNGQSQVDILCGRYSVLLGNMTQTNTRTGYSRGIRCRGVPADTSFDLYLGFLEDLQRDMRRVLEYVAPVQIPAMVSIFAKVVRRMRRPAVRAAWGPRARDVRKHERRVQLMCRKLVRAAESGSLGGGLHAQPSSYHVGAPWSAMGIIRYSIGGNGRENRAKAIRWVVRDVIIDPRDEALAEAHHKMEEDSNQVGDDLFEQRQQQWE